MFGLLSEYRVNSLPFSHECNQRIFKTSNKILCYPQSIYNTFVVKYFLVIAYADDYLQICQNYYGENSTSLTRMYKHLRGRSFDSEGGGGRLALLVGTEYLFSSRARPENLFPGKPRTEYLFSTATNF